MMGWPGPQIRDLAENQRLEATCKRCGNVHYIDLPRLQAEASLAFPSISINWKRRPHAGREGAGQVRLSLIFDGDTKGFVGGLA
ncbi:MAG: hypothetical protein R3D43_09405 [Tepidamorphaceae bacterium]